MKILYFNWVPTRALKYDGGGVSIYQNNLLNYFSKSEEDVYYLTSSYTYDFISRKPYIRTVESPDIEGVNEYELVNSPILAPSFYSFNQIKGYFEYDDSIRAIKDFLKQHGPFDVIHFNNLEGISGKVLDLKKEFPDTKFVLSLHNYFPFCPQVNLWYQDRENCLDYENGEKCINCNLFPIDYRMKEFERYNRNNTNQSLKYKIMGKIYSTFLAQKKFDNGDLTFADRRSGFVQLINENVDVVIAVSKRVKEIAVKMGVNADKCIVNYIGSKHAALADSYKNIMQHEGILSIAYMGYMRRDKGFYFWLDTLEAMPEDIASRLTIVVAAPVTDHHAYDRLMGMQSKFHQVIVHNGYNADNIKDILKDVNLGIVPVLWEDNLPQVALEMTAYGIPILTSDLGGAQEITNSEDFIFEAGNAQELINKIQVILEDKNSLSAFWKNETEKRVLNSVDEHCQFLSKLYATL